MSGVAGREHYGEGSKGRGAGREHYREGSKCRGGREGTLQGEK